MPPRRSGRRMNVQPPPQPVVSSSPSRQLSPAVANINQGQSNYKRYLHKALEFGIYHGLPMAATWALTMYGKPIYRTIKDIANYGKRMTINALAAIRSTPFKEVPANTTQSASTPTPTATPSVAASSASLPTATAIPRPTPDKQYPRTSFQLYNDH